MRKKTAAVTGSRGFFSGKVPSAASEELPVSDVARSPEDVLTESLLISDDLEQGEAWENVRYHDVSACFILKG